MTLHVAPGDESFGTQRTVIEIFHSMNIHVLLSVVCGCMVFAIYTPNINMITMNKMSHWYIFLVLQVFFFYKPDYNNQNGNVWSPHMFHGSQLNCRCSTAKLKKNLRNHDCIPQFLSIFSILSKFSLLYWLSCSFIDIHCRVSKSHGCTVVRPRKIFLTLRKILRFSRAN